MERPQIGYCQRIDLAPNVLLVDRAKLHELIEWSVWAEQELSKLHQHTVSGAVCDIVWCLGGRVFINGEAQLCEKCKSKQTDR
jgi:hypothetical protein